MKNPKLEPVTGRILGEMTIPRLVTRYLHCGFQQPEDFDTLRAEILDFFT